MLTLQRKLSSSPICFDGTREMSNSDQQLPKVGAIMMPETSIALLFQVPLAKAAEPPDGFDENRLVVAAGPISRNRRVRLQTRKLLKRNSREVSMTSTLSVLAGFASHRRHNFPFSPADTTVRRETAAVRVPAGMRPSPLKERSQAHNLYCGPLLNCEPECRAQPDARCRATRCPAKIW